MNIMVNRIRVFLAVLTLVVVTSLGYSQSCYVQLADATGVSISGNLSELEAAACELRQTLPQQYQSEFVVYDIGFYSFNKNMDGGSQAVWDKIVQEVQTPYYLVFGRELSVGRGGAKLWIGLKLPNVSGSPCNGKEEYIIDRLSASFDPVLSPSDIGQKEIDAMQLVQTLKTCEICDNDIDDDGDGLVDCADLDCTYYIFSSAKTSSEQANRVSGCVVPNSSQIVCLAEYRDYLSRIGIYDFERGLAYCDALAALRSAPTSEPSLIDIGITIVSSHVPSLNFSLSFLPNSEIAQTSYRHPHNPPYVVAPDMEYGRDGDTTVINENNAGQLDWSNADLETNMTSLLRWASLGAYDDIAQKYAARFYGGTGADYTDADLSEAIIQTTELQNKVMLFATDLERELEAHGGDIWAVSPIQLEPRRRPLFTPANGYLTMGPTILLNDVEQISYHVSNYSIDTLGNWQGDFFVAVIDHFGLDDEDPTHRKTLVDPIDLWFIETGRISTPVYQD